MADCTDPMALDDEELLRYIFDEGTLNEGSKQHLEQCQLCQQRLSDYRQMNAVLLSQLYRAQCPDGMQLALYCANALSVDEIFSIDEHLRECLLCSEEVATIKQENAHFMPFSEPVGQSLPQVALRALRRLIAQPVTRPLDMAVREDPSSSEWPWQYQAEGFDISFQLARTNDNQQKLLGFFANVTLEQLQDLQGVVVDLYHAPAAQAEAVAAIEQPIMSTTVDDLGDFAFVPIQPGSYSVIIHLAGNELVIEGLNVK
jgi:hypothetical protein